MISALRDAGLHPVDLSMSADFTWAGVEMSFPVQVAAEEAAAAKEILDACERTKDTR